MKNLKLSVKLYISFGIVAALFLIVGIVNLASINKMSELQDIGAKRGTDATTCAEFSAVPYKIYQTVANGIINKNIDDTKSRFKILTEELKGDSKADLRYIIPKQNNRKNTFITQEHVLRFHLPFLMTPG